MTDSANFNPAYIEAIFGPRPLCFQTALRADDAHHILGRGYDFGIRPRYERRRIFSSPFNFAPLIRTVHHGPLRDTPAQRYVYLGVAYRHVMNAVGLGTYELTEADHAFSEFTRQWLYEKSLPDVY